MDKPCDVCGQPATIRTRDIQETEPDYDSGQAWKHYEPCSGFRYGCETHPPDPARVFDSRGVIEVA